MKAFAVIPAFNESTTIGAVVAAVREEGLVAVVIDDRSSDGTAQLAREAGAFVVRHALNLGQGAALQTGIDFALRRGAEAIVTFDADGQHRASDIAALLEPLVDGRADFALGSRFLGSQNLVPPMRRRLLRLATWFTRLDSGLPLTDAHNGLRAMTARGARRIRLRQNRMAHASEILAQIARTGLPWVEVPVSIDYTDYSMAKGQKAGDAVRILADLAGQGLGR